MSMWFRFAQHLKATSYKLINKKIRKWPSLRKDKWPNCVSRLCHRVSLVLWDPSEHDHSWSFIGHLTSADATLLPQSTIHGAKGLSEYPHMASTFPHSNSQKSYICSPLRVHASFSAHYGCISLPLPPLVMTLYTSKRISSSWWGKAWVETVHFALVGPPWVDQWVKVAHP